jgi:hypothetical protein
MNPPAASSTARLSLNMALWIASAALLAQAWIAFLPFQLDDHLLLRDPLAVFHLTSAAAEQGPGASEPTMLRWTLWSLWTLLEALQGRPLSPGSFHLVGLAIHALVCASIGACATRLWGARLSPLRPWLPGLLAGLAAALSTGAIEAVSWPSAWGDSLAALFGCWALLALLRARDARRPRGWLVAATLLLLLALFAKESAIVVPALVGLGLLAPLSRSSVEPALRSATPTGSAAAIPHSAASAAASHSPSGAAASPASSSTAPAHASSSATTLSSSNAAATRATPDSSFERDRVRGWYFALPLVVAGALYGWTRIAVLGGLNLHHGPLEFPAPAQWFTGATAVARSFAQALYPWNQAPEFADQVPWLARAQLAPLAALAWATPLALRFALAPRARTPILLGVLALALALSPCLLIASGAPTNVLSRALYVPLLVAWVLWAAAIAALWSTPRLRWFALACVLTQATAQFDARAHVITTMDFAVAEIEALDRCVEEARAEHARARSDLPLTLIHICGDPGLGGIPTTGMHSALRYVPPFWPGELAGAANSEESTEAVAAAAPAGTPSSSSARDGAKDASQGDTATLTAHAAAGTSARTKPQANTRVPAFEVRAWGTLSECERDWPTAEFAERDIVWIGLSGDPLAALARSAGAAELRAARMPRALSPLRRGLAPARRAALTFRTEPLRASNSTGAQQPRSSAESAASSSTPPDAPSNRESTPRVQDSAPPSAPTLEGLRYVPSAEIPAHALGALELQFAPGPAVTVQLVLEAGRTREPFPLPLSARDNALRTVVIAPPPALARLLGAPIQAFELANAPPLSYQPRLRPALPSLSVLEPRAQAIVQLDPDTAPRITLSSLPRSGAPLELQLEIALQLPIGRLGLLGYATGNDPRLTTAADSSDSRAAQSAPSAPTSQSSPPSQSDPSSPPAPSDASDSSDSSDLSDSPVPVASTVSSDSGTSPLEFEFVAFRFEAWPRELPSLPWGDFVRQVLEPEMQKRGRTSLGGASRVVIRVRGSALLAAASEWRPITLRR